VHLRLAPKPSQLRQRSAARNPHPWTADELLCYPSHSHGTPTRARLPSISLASYLRLVRGNRNFRRLWLAQIVSEIGDWFYTLSIYTLLLQLTGHASSVALALVLQVLPQTFVGPTAGVVNDRLRRKQVMIVADLVRFIVVLAMLLVRSRSTVWLVYPFCWRKPSWLRSSSRRAIR
jgi:Na+/melibiose symporter-like transporter